jgi:hypothetical protein
MDLSPLHARAFRTPHTDASVRGVFARRDDRPVASTLTLALWERGMGEG